MLQSQFCNVVLDIFYISALAFSFSSDGRNGSYPAERLADILSNRYLHSICFGELDIDRLLLQEILDKEQTD